jgi:hypothetical protein
MTYQEAITSIKQSNNLYIGIFFRPEDKYFGYYKIHRDYLDDPEYIGISFEGGYLFSSCGEEEFYSLADVPEEAKSLNYKNAEGLPDITFDCSEYALFKLFPNLPNPDVVRTDEEKSQFVKLVKDQVNDFITS